MQGRSERGMEGKGRRRNEATIEGRGRSGMRRI